MMYALELIVILHTFSNEINCNYAHIEVNWL